MGAKLVRTLYPIISIKCPHRWGFFCLNHLMYRVLLSRTIGAKQHPCLHTIVFGQAFNIIQDKRTGPSCSLSLQFRQKSSTLLANLTDVRIGFVNNHDCLIQPNYSCKLHNPIVSFVHCLLAF